ncbi:hypothetical protein Desca_1822 [Desulfotomaculum nigrificans CO-1-SRB]|uniref:Uncharacterized protein n=1 Tax=Desulfotomaculum nigrificans (strain DSM 14880 / VKM B-2319 / CO-1-SRB) TaxID=868595 RepID=F6B8A4_DESCC|nr:hypothetical protein [Desulfotomaculum nigrificans]AEF94668.1 hypothetical protein Desca_1822 [Desulfotomaculum nigrificans CO-1-SRB]
MINRLREVIGNIAVCADAGDRPAAMREIARFTVLFDEFLRQNKDYIFGHEIESLNRCMNRMLACMEEGDLGGLAEIAGSALRGFLDGWDFHNKPAN